MIVVAIAEKTMPMRRPWRLLPCTAVLVLLSLACSHAFRPSSWTFLERSLLAGNCDEDLFPGGAATGRVEDDDPLLPVGVWEDGSILDAMTSREGFLRNVVGVGVGIAAGMSCEVEPANALFEDVRKSGKCPTYQAVPNFDVDKYMGVWYELAYHDWTQIIICGCTRFNMTRTDSRIVDAFTTTCPYEEAKAETFLINMKEAINWKSPGSFQEYAFYNTWDNKVVALWRRGDGKGGEVYERAIQMQCVEVLGRRAFVGINFLSRQPIVSPAVLDDMFDKARGLGLAEIGGNPAEMEIVRHAGCRYPSSTDASLNRERRSWGSGWGVNTLQL